MTAADVIRIERPTTDSKIFANTRWDLVPTLAGFFHLGFFLAMFFLYPHTPLSVMLIMGFVYALMINANINGVSHNFIHNSFFRLNWMNRAFGIVESIACCFSQTYYDVVHMQHHKGNADRPDEHGETIDWISIYRHGHEGEAEHPLSYMFLSFFRDDPKAIFAALKRKNPREAYWGVAEIALFMATFVIL